MPLPDKNVFVVPVSASCNVEHESLLIDQLFTLELEMLLPDVVTGAHGAVVALWLDAAGFGVEDEDLVWAVASVADDDLASCPCDGTSTLQLGDKAEWLTSNESIFFTLSKSTSC